MNGTGHLSARNLREQSYMRTWRLIPLDSNVLIEDIINAKRWDAIEMFAEKLKNDGFTIIDLPGNSFEYERVRWLKPIYESFMVVEKNNAQTKVQIVEVLDVEESSHSEEVSPIYF